MHIDGLALVSQPVKFCGSKFYCFCVGMGCFNLVPGVPHPFDGGGVDL